MKHPVIASVARMIRDGDAQEAETALVAVADKEGEVGQAAQHRPIGTGNADEFRDHVHRDLAGEVGDEVERAVRKGWLQVLDGDLSHPVLELGHGPRREALVGELADPGVLGRIHGEERHGLAGV